MEERDRDWIKCQSKSHPNRFFMFNKSTGQTRWCSQNGGRQMTSARLLNETPPPQIKPTRTPAQDRLKRLQADLKKAKKLAPKLQGKMENKVSNNCIDGPSTSAAAAASLFPMSNALNDSNPALPATNANALNFPPVSTISLLGPPTSVFTTANTAEVEVKRKLTGCGILSRRTPESSKITNSGSKSQKKSVPLRSLQGSTPTTAVNDSISAQLPLTKRLIAVRQPSRMSSREKLVIKNSSKARLTNRLISQKPSRPPKNTSLTKNITVPNLSQLSSAKNSPTHMSPQTFPAKSVSSGPASPAKSSTKRKQTSSKKISSETVTKQNSPAVKIPEIAQLTAGPAVALQESLTSLGLRNTVVNRIKGLCETAVLACKTGTELWRQVTFTTPAKKRAAVTNSTETEPPRSLVVPNKVRKSPAKGNKINESCVVSVGTSSPQVSSSSAIPVELTSPTSTQTQSLKRSLPTPTFAATTQTQSLKRSRPTLPLVSSLPISLAQPQAQSTTSFSRSRVSANERLANFRRYLQSTANNGDSDKSIKSSSGYSVQSSNATKNVSGGIPHTSSVDECEPMDWEPIDTTEIVSTKDSTLQKSENFSTGNTDDDAGTMGDYYDTVNENLMRMSAQRNKVTNNKWRGDHFYIVPDTNIFLNKLTFIGELEKMAFGGTAGTVIYIPYRVLQELDKLKLRIATPGVKVFANRAIKYLNNKFVANDAKIQCQSALDERDHIIDVSSADDSIINCCLQLKQRVANIMLLSDDINLCNKAMANDILVSTHSDLISKHPNSFGCQ